MKQAFIITLLMLGAWLIWVRIAQAEPINFERLADAIHHAENGARLDAGGECYGIHTVHYSNEADARRICLRTIRRQWRREAGFTALAKRYCPINWQVWKRNVMFYYNGGSKHGRRNKGSVTHG